MKLLVTFRLAISLGFAALVFALAATTSKSPSSFAAIAAMIAGVGAASAFFYTAQLEAARQELEQGKRD